MIHVSLQNSSNKNFHFSSLKTHQYHIRFGGEFYFPPPKKWTFRLLSCPLFQPVLVGSEDPPNWWIRVMIFVQVILAEGKMDKKKSAWCTAVPWALWIACSVGVKWGLLVYPSLEKFQEVSPAWTFHWDHHFPFIIPSLDSIFLEGGLALGVPLDFHDILMVAMSYSVISTWAFSLTAVGPAELIQDSNVMSDESYWDALILILIEFGPAAGKLLKISAPRGS